MCGLIDADGGGIGVSTDGDGGEGAADITEGRGNSTDAGGEESFSIVLISRIF